MSLPFVFRDVTSAETTLPCVVVNAGLGQLRHTLNMHHRLVHSSFDLALGARCKKM